VDWGKQHLKKFPIHAIHNGINIETFTDKMVLIHSTKKSIDHPFSQTTWVSQYQKGETSLDLNDARDDGVLGWQWHQLDRMQTICTSLKTDNHINTSSLNFYRSDALPDAQPTASKH